MADIILVDSYSESNYYNAYSIRYTGHEESSQSFTGKAGNLINCKWYLRKRANPTGNIIAKLYSHSGTYGTSSLPNTLLATSDIIDIATLPTSFGLIIFNFTGAEQYLLVEGTKYCIVIEYSGGSFLNCLCVGQDYDTATHSGNAVDNDGGVWETYPNIDYIFYVYAEETTPCVEPPYSVISIAKPITLKTTKEINGAWTANIQILPDDYISAESYVDVAGEQYIAKNVKKIKSGKTYFDVSLYHNMFELTDLTIDRFSLLKTPTYLLDYILTDCEWIAGDCDIDEIVYLRTDKRTTILEALNLLAEQCGGELYFYSQDRIVDLKREIGTHTGLQIRYDKNSDYIEKEEDSNELITRIYPYGSDNFEINSTILDNCEDETDYSPSGAGSTEASDEKQQGAQAIKLISSTLNETFINDLGAGNVKDLSGHDLLKFWVYSEVANANGFTFGIGEAAYTEQTVNTGALDKECWKEVELDLSEVADGDKNEIRYIGFKNLTGGAVEIVIDSIRAFSGNIYIDSPNIAKYKVRKEYTYRHSAKPEKEQFEKIIYPSDDSYTYQKAPNTNYGTVAVLWIRGATNSYDYLFFKFDLSDIPAEAIITSTILYIYIQQIYGFLVTSAATYLCNANWAENTITWNNQPAVLGDNIHTFNFGSVGWKNCDGDMLTTVQNWHSGAANNYGITIRTTQWALAHPTSKEGINKPYLKVEYIIETDPSSVIKAAALDYLLTHDEPKLKYKVNMVDLSKVMVNTWEDEAIDLGDTVRVYDSELKINTNCRIKKITKNLLDPSDVSLELVNKAYSIADLEAKRAKQLSYAMPFMDNPKIIDAGAVQAGYFGGDVQK